MMIPNSLRRAVPLLALAASPLAAQQPGSTTPPALPEPPALVVPTIERAALTNGLQLQVITMNEVPLVQATLVITGGARLDGSHPGLATFTAGMLDEGAGERDAFELAEELEFLGATLSTAADWNQTLVVLRAPKRTFAEALMLLGDVVLRPTFAAEEVARQRQLRIASQVARRDQPSAVAALVSNAAVFPAGHPYARPIDGDSAATAALDSALVRSFWERTAMPARATLVMVGDLSTPEALRMANAALGPWRSPGVPPAPMVDQVPQPARQPTRVVLVDKPGAAQSVIRIAAPGADRRSPDYAALELMNTILGGSFSSRLNDILREQKGYTYGAGSGFGWDPIPGAFVASAAVRTDVTDSSLAIFMSELGRIRAEPVSEAELERARAYMVLGALGDFETTRQVSGQVVGLMPFGLPIGTVASDLEHVRGVTAADVQRVAREYVDPGRSTITVVGDLATIRPGVEALGLGPVEVRDVEGRPLE